MHFECQKFLHQIFWYTNFTSWCLDAWRNSKSFFLPNTKSYSLGSSPNTFLVLFGTRGFQVPKVLQLNFCYFLPMMFRSILPKSKEKNSKSFGKNGELNTRCNHPLIYFDSMWLVLLMPVVVVELSVVLYVYGRWSSWSSWSASRPIDVMVSFSD